MREALDLKSKSGVHRLILHSEERGFIRRARPTGREPWSLETAEGRPAGHGERRRQLAAAPANDAIDIPFPADDRRRHAHRGSAGYREFFRFEHASSGPGEHYVLEASGDFMVEEGILGWRFALIRSTTAYREIVVALIDNEEATSKALFRRRPDDPAGPRRTRVMSERDHEQRVQIQGRLAG